MAFKLDPVVGQDRAEEGAEMEIDGVEIGALGRAEDADAAQGRVDTVLRDALRLGFEDQFEGLADHVELPEIGALGKICRHDVVCFRKVERVIVFVRRLTSICVQVRQYPSYKCN